MLNEGMVCGVHTGAEWIETFSITVIGRVSSGSQHPVLPAQIAEADVQFMFFTRGPIVHRSVVVDTWHRQVGLGFSAALVRPDSAGRTARDLALPEERHHERLFGARTSSAHQPDPSSRERPVLLCLHVQSYAEVAAWMEEPVVCSRGHIKSQPALLPSGNGLHVQQHQLRLPEPVVPLYLIDGDVQCAVGPLSHREGLIDPKLCCSHSLALRQRRQVKAELFPVWSWLQQIPLLLH